MHSMNPEHGDDETKDFGFEDEEHAGEVEEIIEEEEEEIIVEEPAAQPVAPAPAGGRARPKTKKRAKPMKRAGKKARTKKRKAKKAKTRKTAKKRRKKR